MEFRDVYSGWLKELNPKDKDFSKQIAVRIRAASIYFRVKEEWKPVEGYSGYYEISNFGRLASVRGSVDKKRVNARMKERRILGLHPNKNGYVRVPICVEYKLKQHLAHRLVAQHYVENPLSKPEVNHIDSIRHNNYEGNLEYATQQENSLHGYRYGKHHSPKGKNAFRSIPVVMLTMDGEYVRRFDTAIEAMQQTGANSANICWCCRGRRPKAGGHRWMYASDYDGIAAQDRK